VKFQVKFKEEAASAARQEIIRDLSKKGAADVRPLFPGTSNPRLGAMYVVEHPAPRPDLLDYLNGVDAVEYAEAEVKRQPVDRTG
jgi:hypothetical protein